MYGNIGYNRIFTVVDLCSGIVKEAETELCRKLHLP